MSLAGEARSGPLAGVTVIEWASYITGPYAAMLLADLGATVLKIEDPRGGDPFRGPGEAGYAAMFQALNRSKLSITLDLRLPRAASIVERLVADADAFIENHRPGTAARLGVSYDALRRHNPGLVYCAISGYGQTGPQSQRPGYDTIGQASSGVLSLLTDLADPAGVGISIADHVTGLNAAIGTLAGIVRRRTSGEGSFVDTSLLQSSIAFIGENVARYLESGDVPDRHQRNRLAQVYACAAADGLPLAIHLSSPQKFFVGLCAGLGRPEMVEDPRFATAPSRVAHFDELHALLRAEFATRSREDWLATLHEHDVPAAPINQLDEMLEDEQVRHLEMVRSVHHPVAGDVPYVRGPVNIDGAEAAVQLPPPLLGEHTDAVLAAHGFSPSELTALHADGVV